MKPKIKLALSDHPRTRAFLAGEVEVDGYELEIRHNFLGRAGERHHRFVQGEFDVSEFSAATYLRTKEQGFRFTALPVFFERGPRQRNIFCREDRIGHPTELRNQRIGCQHYGATAVVWARGFLLDEYGLRTADMEWFAYGREPHIGIELPVKVTRPDPLPPWGEDREPLAKLVSEGSLEAAIVAGDMGHLGIFGGGILPGMMGRFPEVKPLFRNTEEIIHWIKEKRIYPIIHLIAMGEAILEQHPDLAAKLIFAFREAKRLSVQYMTPELIASLEREKEILGEDPYAYRLGEIERRTLEALMRYQIEQGLMRKSVSVEGLFVREARN
jgi:4,5-dihydroxyphthalate decarboxylase